MKLNDLKDNAGARKARKIAHHVRRWNRQRRPVRLTADVRLGDV